MSVFRGASVGVTLTANKTKYSRELKAARAEMRDWQRSVDSSMSKAKRGIGAFGRAAAIGIGAAGIAAGAASVKMIQMASDAGETASKMRVTFGASMGSIVKDLDAFSRATGASRYELREQATTIGALLKPMKLGAAETAKMSVSVTKLATDLSSFNNVPVEDALQSLKSGLTGEAEPLKKFGILINDAALKAEGLRLKLVSGKQEMSEQQKVQARLSLIMQQTSDAQGDATRTADGFANTTRRLQNSIKDAGTEIGERMLPTVTRLANGLATFVSSDKFAGYVDSLGDAAERAAGSVARFMQSPQAAQMLRDAANTVQLFGSALASTTRFMLEHRTAITNLAIGYGAFRVVTGILTPLNAAWQLGQANAVRFAAANAGASRAAIASRVALGALGGPIGLVAAGLSIGAVAWVNYKQKMASVKSQSELTKASILSVSRAMQGLSNEALALDEARLNKKMALASLEDAKRRLAGATKGTREYRDALHGVESAQLQLERANLDAKSARQAFNTAIKSTVTAHAAAKNEAAKERKAIADLDVQLARATKTRKSGVLGAKSAAAEEKRLSAELKEARGRLDDANQSMDRAADRLRNMSGRTDTARAAWRDLAAAIRDANSAAASYTPPPGLGGGGSGGNGKSGRMGKAGAALAQMPKLTRAGLAAVGNARLQMRIDANPTLALNQAQTQMKAADVALVRAIAKLRTAKTPIAKAAARTALGSARTNVAAAGANVAQKEAARREALAAKDQAAADAQTQAAADLKEAAELQKQAATEARQAELDIPRTAMTLTDAMRDLERAQAEATETTADDLAVARQSLADEQRRQDLIRQVLGRGDLTEAERAEQLNALAASVRATTQLAGQVKELDTAGTSNGRVVTLADLQAEIRAAAQAIVAAGATEAGNVFNVAKVEQSFPAGTGLDTWRLATTAQLQGAAG